MWTCASNVLPFHFNKIKVHICFHLVHLAEDASFNVGRPSSSICPGTPYTVPLLFPPLESHGWAGLSHSIALPHVSSLCEEVTSSDLPLSSLIFSSTVSN